MYVLGCLDVPASSVGGGGAVRAERGGLDGLADKWEWGRAGVVLAYTFFGVAFFAQCSPRFANFDDAAVNLFAILNGDEIADSFNDIYKCQVRRDRTMAPRSVGLLHNSMV